MVASEFLTFTKQEAKLNTVLEDTSNANHPNEQKPNLTSTNKPANSKVTYPPTKSKLNKQQDEEDVKECDASLAETKVKHKILNTDNEVRNYTAVIISIDSKAWQIISSNRAF